MKNVIVEVGGRHYHPENHPAPYGWARTTGERVTLEGYDGLWCEVTNDQEPFTFSMNRDSVTIMSGFKNPDLNGRACLSLAVLLRKDLDYLKVAMKEAGLPSCTRLNVLACFEWWYESNYLRLRREGEEVI